MGIVNCKTANCGKCQKAVLVKQTKDSYIYTCCPRRINHHPICANVCGEFRCKMVGSLNLCDDCLQNKYLIRK